jgi:hypothetical protein
VSGRPSAEFQLRFLQDLQRILEEGVFTATYKFALVHALADLSVQRGDDSGGELRLPVRAIAERFVELYWRQAAPWPAASGELRVLAQNTGRQAAVVNRVREVHPEYDRRLDRLRRDEDAWRALTSEVDRIIRVMPLWKLQRVGGEVHDFLYPQNHLAGRGRDAAIVLRPGIAFCFRTFHPLVLDLVRGAWIRFVRKLNPELLGEHAELGEFLFGAPRAVLAALRPPLLELQEEACFYCRRRIRDGGHVDHFVPWSRYPVDLGHNFVAAHERCNLNKSDFLAGEEHLERWARRNDEVGYDLERVFEGAGMGHDLGASLRITGWAYRQVEERGGVVWVQGRDLAPLGEGWRGVLSVEGSAG